MRAARFLLPLTLSLMLVGCDAWMRPKPVDDAMMHNDAAMNGGETGWDEGEITVTEGEVYEVEGDDHMMGKDDAMMKGGDAMMKDDGMKKEDSMMKDEKAVVAKASYATYSSDVLMNGETKVLFFHAAWCPTCKKADASLSAWYAANAYGRSTYKVDYDASADLKAKYGVTYQHTFVLVDGQGNALQVIQGPTDAQLQAMLQA